MIDNLKHPKFTLKANIKNLSHDGRGIATIDHKTTFISGALPDEIVTYQITKKHERYQEAIVKDVLSASSARSIPVCEHFGICGGCSLQHLNDPLQIALKQQTLLEQLKHFGNVVPDNLLPPLTAQTSGYRRKARLGVKFVIKKNKVLVGFREKSSRYLADLNVCHTLHPAIGLKLPVLSELISSLSIKEHIPQIEVAMGDEEIALVIRHMMDLTSLDHETLIAFAKAEHFHLYLQPNAPLPISKLYPDDEHHRLRYSLPAHNIEFLFYPLDFTQINLDLNRLMINQALDLLALTREDRVLDLFCGIGNFSLPLAKYAKEVVGIEGEKEMVERAKENARHNHLDNVIFHSANLFSPQLTDTWLHQSYTKLLLDPPRTGAKEILPYLAQFDVQKILYISCNPATLARDAGEIVKTHGYRLTHAGIMNMFPHTAHTEAMALFEKT